MHSAIYTGQVRHRRLGPKPHQFSYPIYMLALDLDELDEIGNNFSFFKQQRFSALSFYREDYLGDPSSKLKQAVLHTLSDLGGDASRINTVILVGQVRCFGIYFSPVNFYFCYEGKDALYMIAEVRNTPWNERHCYLVNINDPEPSKKEFHVSPFMDMNMVYHWHIKAPSIKEQSPEDKSKKMSVHIENWNEKKLFDATLTLSHKEFSNQAIKGTLLLWPIMSISILKGIYWQALKLFCKFIPFQAHH